MARTLSSPRGLTAAFCLFDRRVGDLCEQAQDPAPSPTRMPGIFTRFFFSGASECALDKQGRISIPAPLRKHARLEKETKIIGVSNRLEIWNTENWDNYNNMDVSDIADKMAELGI